MDIINIFRYLFPFYCLRAAAAADFFSSLGSFVFYKFCISVSRGCSIVMRGKKQQPAKIENL